MTTVGSTCRLGFPCSFHGRSKTKLGLISGAAMHRGVAHPRNWVHWKIPGCAVEINTQNCAWFGSQTALLITATSFRQAVPPEPPTRGSAHGPRWGTSVLQTPCAPHIQILATPLFAGRRYRSTAGAGAQQ